MITVKKLHKSFGIFHVLKSIDMHVSRGEIYGFIGQNGAGKTTTMNILTGLSRPTGGYCIVNGKDVSGIQHPGELHIGYLPEEPRFYPWMSAYETLEYLGNSATPARINELLGWVGLSKAARRKVGGFSRGMKQRLGIGAALIRDPELLILDEPSSALDPEGRSDVLRLITELKQMGKTVLFSTHILSDVERICDTVGMIAEGRIILEKPMELLQKQRTHPVFDVEPAVSLNHALLEKIKQINCIKDIKYTGKKLAVTGTSRSEASKCIMRFFADNNIAVTAFALRKNNLEELFIQEVNNK